MKMNILIITTNKIKSYFNKMKLKKNNKIKK